MSELNALHRPERLVFLGDFLHAATGRTPPVLKALSDWRERHRSVTMTLVRGNHDHRAGDPPPEARIEVVDEPWLLGPFACCHHPQTHATHFVLAGHLHPVCHLSGPARDAMRLPCFVSEPGQAVLPAFGAFTGGHALPAAPGRCFHAIGGQRVWAVPGT
ncbi:DEAD/DEAH box helicase [Hydrogenophaga sp. SL48]|nr:DEAD/DEAH box helicase [Hydrogenophaga sp. SL48]